MNLKRTLSSLLALSTLCFIPSCGSDSNSISEVATEATVESNDDFREVGFYKDKISINIKPEWQYNVNDNSLTVKAANDKSSVYITAEDLGYDLGEMDFANIYNKMKQGANNVMRVSKLTPLEDSNMYAFSYYDLEISAEVHVFMFVTDGTLFTMFFGEDSGTKQGDIVKNISTVLDPIIKERSK